MVIYVPVSADCRTKPASRSDHEPVLHRLAGIDAMPLDAVSVGPLQEGLAGDLGLVVVGNSCGEVMATRVALR